MQTLTNNEYLKQRLQNLWTSKEEKENKIINLTEENKKKILALKDKCKGERCFIIGSSPSLSQLDLTKLNNEYTFTVNRGYKLETFGLNKFTYHILQDTDLYNQKGIKEEIPYNKYKNIFLYAGVTPEANYSNIIYYDYMKMMNYQELAFQTDLTKLLPEGYTVIFSALEFAYWLGFSKVYIVGVDLDYTNLKGYVYAETEQEKQRQKKSFMNAKRMMQSIKTASEHMQSSGIQVYNASPTGCLNCIPKVNYEELFNA